MSYPLIVSLDAAESKANRFYNRPMRLFYWRYACCLFTAMFFIAAGIFHFRWSGSYVRITPPMFPHRMALVRISGFFEIAGGVGLMIPRLRTAAAWGLILLLISVFPANIYMLTNVDQFADIHISRWLLWIRLPLQGILIWWVWWVSQRMRNTLPN